MRHHHLAGLVAGACAITLSACGGSSGDSEPAAERSPQEGALRFAKCMRDHGVDFPDPQVSGNGLVKIQGPKGVRPDDPRVRSAQEACQHFLEESGPQLSDEQKARFEDAFLKYARCMRGHGVDLPDPKPGSRGGFTIMRGRGEKSVGPDPESPAFKAADAACHKLLADVDKAVKP